MKLSVHYSKGSVYAKELPRRSNASVTALASTVSSPSAKQTRSAETHIVTPGIYGNRRRLGTNWMLPSTTLFPARKRSGMII